LRCNTAPHVSLRAGSNSKDAAEQTQVQVNQQRIVNRSIARIRIIARAAKRAILSLDHLARAQDKDDALQMNLDRDLVVARGIPNELTRRSRLSDEASAKTALQQRSVRRAMERERIERQYGMRNEELTKFANEPGEKQKVRAEEAAKKEVVDAAERARQKAADAKALANTSTGRVVAAAAKAKLAAALKNLPKLRMPRRRKSNREDNRDSKKPSFGRRRL